MSKRASTIVLAVLAVIAVGVAATTDSLASAREAIASHTRDSLPSRTRDVDCNGNGIPDDVETQVTFSEEVISYTVTSGTLAVDIDGDTDLDLLSLNFGDDLVWYENDGSQSFQLHVIVSNMNDITDIGAADMDGDGDPDPIVMNLQGSYRIFWYENLGSGSFGSARLVTYEAGREVLFTDLDADGDLDLAAVWAGNAGWFENDGDGNFGPANIVMQLPAVVSGSLAAEDVDGDGDPDLLVAAAASTEPFWSKVVWYANADGRGTFDLAAPVIYVPGYVGMVRAADLDGDGDVDALTASGDHDTIAWYENLNGLGLFGPRRVISTGDTWAEVVMADDVDGDGDVDVLASAPLVWFENEDGLGNFASLQPIATSDPMQVVDLDQDGNLDVLTVPPALWQRNQSNDCNANAVPDDCDLDLGSSFDCNGNDAPDECDIRLAFSDDCNANGQPDECDVGSPDCNANGVPDECEPDCNANGVADSCDISGGSSLDCTGNGVPDECEPDCNGNGTADSCDIDGGGSGDCDANGVPDECDPDCNGNGVPDACDIDGGGSGDCDGNGIPDECEPDCDLDGTPDACQTVVTFGEHVIAAGLSGASEVVLVADLDGDGDDDVLSTGDDRILWFENLDGTGVFGAPQIISDTAYSVSTIFAADLDNDGDLDVLASFPLTWYENEDGNGNFGDAQLVVDDMTGGAVLAFDLDNDDDLDVVYAQSNRDVIAWHANDGTGNFGERRIISTEIDRPRLLAAADVDRDGDVDLISTSYGIYWHENTDGRGTYAPPRVVSDIPWVDTLTLVDLDGDGDVDVVYSDAPNTVAWLENVDGLDQLGPERFVTTDVNGPKAAAAVDMDADGDVDVVVTSTQDDTVTWHEQIDGSGMFGPNWIVSAGGLNAARTASVVDMDGDGDLDVVAASSNQISWFENEGNDCNGNDAPDQCDVPTADCNGNEIPDDCEADCNGNGVDDACDISAGTSVDCTGNGIPDECEDDCNGNTAADSCDIADTTSDDCNGNEIPDECEADCNLNGIADTCDITSITSTDCNVNGIPDECDIASGFSLDADGDLIPDECQDCNDNGVLDSEDIAGTTSSDCDGNGIPDECDTRASAASTLVVWESPSPWFFSVVATDVDGDADEDLVAAYSYADRLAWFENEDGTGSFGPAQTISDSILRPQSIAAADIDRDGDADLFVGSYTLDKIVWYENLDGAGNFGIAQPVCSFLDGVMSVVAADLDGDGDADALSASVDDGKIVWCENTDGSGTFGDQQLLALSGVGQPEDVVAADLDADGDLDVVYPGSFSIEWLENIDGAGTFAAPQLIATTPGGYPVRGLAAGDLDDDGDLDVLSGWYDDKIAWYENLDGDGTFGPLRMISTAGNQPECVIAADFDGDGDLDVAATHASGLAAGTSGLTWFENLNGAGDFGAEQVVVVSILGLDVSAADIDGDSVVDAIFGTASQIWWHGFSGEDCNRNHVPDVCEADCNGNGIPDECDLSAGTSTDCNANSTPDECETTCSSDCDTDGDGCIDDVDAAPANPNKCGDGDGDGCDDCASGTFDPAADGADLDGDGFCNLGDCSSFWAVVWADPQSISSLTLSETGLGTKLRWQAPAFPGALTVRYDTLRSDAAWDFVASGECLESDEFDRNAIDATTPQPGEVRFYLIRVENDCPFGAGAMGSDSAGVPRTGIGCP